MSVSSVTNRVAYQGDGTSAVYAFGYKMRASSDLGVFIYNSSVVLGGIVTPQYLNIDYSFSGVQNNQGYYPNGGSIVFNSSPDNKAIVVIFRSSIVTNDFQIGQGGTIPSSSLNNELDYLTLLEQRSQDLNTRSVRLHDGFFGNFDPTLPVNPAQSVGKALRINGSGTGFIFDDTLQSYIPNTLVYAATNSSITSLPGGPANFVLTSQGSSAPIWSPVTISALSGIVPNANGGTGTGSSFQRGLIVFAGSSGIYDRSNGMSFSETIGSLTVGSSFVGSAGIMVAGILSLLPLGVSAPLRTETTTGRVINGSTSLTSEVSGVLTPSLGGLGTGSNFVQYGVLYASSATQVSVVPSQAAGRVLTAQGSSAPIWSPVTITNTIVRPTTNYTASINDYIIASGSSFPIAFPSAVGLSGQSITVKHGGSSFVQSYSMIAATSTIQTFGGVASGSYAQYTNGETTVFTSDNVNWLSTMHITHTGDINFGTIFITATAAYVLTNTAAAANAGAVYSHNGFLYTLSATIAGATNSNWSGTGTPAASGTFTKVSGVGDATITFSSRTITGVPTKGGTSVDRLIGHREGQYMVFRAEYRQIGVGSSAGSGDYLCQLPDPLRADTSLVTINTTVFGASAVILMEGAVGFCWTATSAPVNGTGIVSMYNDTWFRPCFHLTNAAASVWCSAANQLTAASMVMTMNFRVPVSGLQP